MIIITSKGRFFDETNQALPGVTVRIKGSLGGTSTNTDGIHTIQARSAESIFPNPIERKP